jgi:hypothetical protein
MVKTKVVKIIRVRIIPLSVLKKRLAAAHLATFDFEDAQKAKWSDADQRKHAKLLLATSDFEDAQRAKWSGADK